MNNLLVITVLIFLFELNDAAAINEQNNNSNNNEEFQLCDPPPCTDDQLETLWPHRNNTFFYQCAPQQFEKWGPVEMPCAPGTVFGFKEQVCIWERDWVDPCDGSISPTSNPEPTGTETTGTETTGAETTNVETTESETTETEDQNTTGSEQVTEETEKPPTSSTSSAIETSPSIETSTMPSTTENPTSAPPTETETSTTETTICSTEPPSTVSTTLPPPIEKCPTPECTNDQVHVLWAVKDEPTKYYQCIPDKNKQCSWNTEVKLCEGGKYFDYKNQECVEQSQWRDVCNEDSSSSTTPGPTTSIPSTTEAPEEDLCEMPLCTDDQTHVLWPSYEGADKYWQCIPKPNGKWEATLQKCENGQLFSYSKQSCAEPQQWEDVCGGLATTETIEEIDAEEEEPKKCTPPKCKNHNERHKFWPAFDPRFYYVCKVGDNQEYKPHMMPCPKDEYFSDQKQACVDPCDWRYSCGPENITYEIQPVNAAAQMSTTIEPNKETTTVVSTEAQTEEITEPPTTTTQRTTTEEMTEPPTTTTQRTTTEDMTTTTQRITTEEITELPTSTTDRTTTEDITDPPTSTTQKTTTEDLTTAESTTESATSTTEAQTTIETTTKIPTTESETESTVTQETTTIDQSTTTTEETTQPSTTVSQPNIGCIVPECKTDLQRNTLWPDEDPNFYLQCIPSEECGWAPMRRPCAKGTWFSYMNQTCVFPCDWVDPCQNASNTTPMPTTTVDTSTTIIPREPTTKMPNTTTKAPVTTKTTAKTTTLTTAKPKETTTTTRTTPSTTTSTRTTPSTTTSTTTTSTTTTKPENVPVVPAGSMMMSESCIPANCDTEEGRQVLYPHPDKNYYIQCSPYDAESWVPLTRPCGPGSVFNYQSQVCVWPEEWQDPCSNQTTTQKPQQPTTVSPTKSTTTTKRPPSTTKPPPPSTTKPTTKRPPPTTTTSPPKTTAANVETTSNQQSCIPPVCTTDSDRLKLYPHPDKTYFYQCVPTKFGFEAIARPCAPGTAFSWRFQVCVHEHDWEDPCSSSSNSNTEPPKKIKKGYHYPKKYNKDFHWV